jgi:pyruvate ferredoxin oxidoreductase delta subunit
MEEIGWKDIKPGNIIEEVANSRHYKTGDWRTGLIPVVDIEKCTRCTLCYIFCPDAAMERRDDGYFIPNLYYCKGCGICAQECPVNCIEMKEEN